MRYPSHKDDAVGQELVAVEGQSEKLAPISIGVDGGQRVALRIGDQR
jgi:hypothetical protein